MNKITIPIILTVTVIIAGFFAFSPVEQATTVHSATLIESTLSQQGASAVVSAVSATATNTFAGADTVQHWFVFESTQPYTLVDIEIQGTLDVLLPDNGDAVSIFEINSFNGEYATTVAGVTLAMITDSFDIQLCQNCDTQFLNGDDRFNTFTYSFIEGEINNNPADPPTVFSFGPNTKIFVQVQQLEDDGDAGDIDSIVTFYVSGPAESDVTVTVFTDQANSNP